MTDKHITNGAGGVQALSAAPGEPVHGDVLPPVGSRVYIRHGRDNDAHACTVTGYYAWGDLGGDKRLHRVFVRLVYEGTDIQQARMLCDCYPTAEAALAQAAPQQEAQEPDAFYLVCEVLRIFGGGPHTITCQLSTSKPETLDGIEFLKSALSHAWRLGAKSAPQPAPAPLSEQDERRAFEQDFMRVLPGENLKRKFGHYEDPRTRHRWDGWKARAALAAQGGK